MKQTPVLFPEFSFDITRDKTVLFLGSCFSEHLSTKLEGFQFKVVSNPLGVVFNPKSIANFILFTEEQLLNENFQRNDVWLNWQANATIFGYSKDELISIIETNRSIFVEGLQTANVLLVTFGTAWVYENLSAASVVANCHKQPSSKFSKRLLSTQEIVRHWSTAIAHLKSIQPGLNIVFTVSPVRHIKNGVVENMRSKAILLEAAHQLSEEHSQVSYFPVFEYFMDELRDYAYYGTDGLHPNTIAVDLVWEKFKQSFLSEKTSSWIKEYQRLSLQLNHRSLHPDSNDAISFANKARREMEDFLSS